MSFVCSEVMAGFFPLCIWRNFKFKPKLSTSYLFSNWQSEQQVSYTSIMRIDIADSCTLPGQDSETLKQIKAFSRIGNLIEMDMKEKELDSEANFTSLKELQ